MRFRRVMNGDSFQVDLIEIYSKRNKVYFTSIADLK